MYETITSSANPIAKRIRQLADRKHRQREKAFVVEGIQPVWRAVESDFEIETLIVAPGLLSNAAALRMVDDAESAGARVVRLSRELFTRLSDRDGPSGLSAIVRSRQHSLEDRTVPDNATYVALHEVGNPGNLGTVIRTADAAGAAGVILIGDVSDPFAPAAVKASMGSLFAVDISHTPTIDAFFSWARHAGVRVIATSGSATTSLWDAAHATPSVLLFGSEGAGLAATTIERSDASVRIPMTGTAESLNLAVAVGILLYEARRGAFTQHGT